MSFTRAAPFALLALAGSAAAHADMPTGTAPGAASQEEREAGSYFGVGLARATAGYDNVDPALNIDFALGWRLPVARWVSGELDASYTVFPGEYRGARRCETTDPSPPPPLGTGDPGGTTCESGKFTRSENGLQMTNVGVFAAIRSPGRLYGVGKFGYRIVNVSLPEIQDGDDTHGTAWTAGAGFRWSTGLAGAELTYTRVSDDIESVGVNIAYGFGASPGPGSAR